MDNTSAVAEDNTLQDLVGVALQRRRGGGMRGGRGWDTEPNLQEHRVHGHSRGKGVDELFKIHLHELKYQIELGVLVKNSLQTGRGEPMKGTSVVIIRGSAHIPHNVWMLQFLE